MELIIQGLIALACLMMLGLGAKSMFAPKSMTANFAIEPVEVAGLSTIRGVIGGLFLASLVMLLAGLATGETLWFLAVAIIMGGVAVGRFASLALDGFAKSVVPPLVVELVIVVLLVAAHMNSGSA